MKISLVRREPQAQALREDALQRDAILHRKKPLILRGSAGTGKTTALIESAISRMNEGVSPDSLLFITYGRENASAIRDTIASRTSSTSAEPLARTFHALAFSILSMDTSEEVRQPVLISGPEQESFIRELLDGGIETGKRIWPEDLSRALETDGFIREVRDMILRSNERGILPEGLISLGRQYSEPYWVAVGNFWLEYQNVAAMALDGSADAKEKLDPSELVARAVVRLKREPKLLEKLRARFTTILVDEFQESDPGQRELLALLASTELVIAVDAPSAVGRFRGADPDGVNTEVDRYISQGAHEIELLTAHATTPAINELAHFALRGPREIDERATNTDDITIALMRSAHEEAQFIAARFKRAHLIEGVPYSHMAVILRSPGSHASTLRRAFAGVGIPVAGHLEALASNPSIAPFLLIAQIATGDLPLTVDRCNQLLLSEFGGADPISLRRIRRSLLLAREEGSQSSSGELLVAAIDKGEIFIEERAELERIHLLLTKARNAARKKGAGAEDLLWAIWDNATTSSGEKISEAWRKQALGGGSRSIIADRDLDAMIQLFDEAARFTERMPFSRPSLFIKQITQESIAADVITSKGIRPDVVEILTVHSAKGRHWDYVAMAGLQDGAWPNLRQRSTLLGSEKLVEQLRYPDVPAEQLKVIAATGLAQDERRLLHVAISRASKKLCITAVSQEDLEPSIYFEELREFCMGPAPEKPVFTEAPRPLSQSALVATLRSQLNSDQSPAAASLLKKLSVSGIAIADPANWSGYLAPSTDLPVIDADQPVPVSPSGGENFEECGLKWFLEKNGGRDGDSTAQLLGTVIHEYARLKAENNEITTSELTSRLASSWKAIDTNQGWVSQGQLARAIGMLERFAKYHEENTREVVGPELRFTINVGRAQIRGSADRLEVSADGGLYIVDFKTGAKEVKLKDAPDNLQLAAYQLAIVLGGFKEHHASQTPSGAELVYLASDNKSGAKVIPQPALTPEKAEQVQERIRSLADGMGASRFTASVSQACDKCGVRASCPINSAGKTVLS